jgi:hypothetical protein
MIPDFSHSTQPSASSWLRAMELHPLHGGPHPAIATAQSAEHPNEPPPRLTASPRPTKPKPNLERIKVAVADKLPPKTLPSAKPTGDLDDELIGACAVPGAEAAK